MKIRHEVEILPWFTLRLKQPKRKLQIARGETDQQSAGFPCLSHRIAGHTPRPFSTRVPMDLHQLTYYSRNNVSGEDHAHIQHLRNILSVSQRNNRREGITG